MKPGGRTFPRILHFVMLSLAAHAALLITWQYPSLIAGQRDSFLSVTLTGTTQPATPARVAAMPLVQQKHPPESLPIHHRQTTAAMNIGHVNPDSATSDESDQPESTANSQRLSPEPVRARLQARLLSELARHFSYPDLARRRGWEGTVLLGLSVESDGRLDKIHVTRSSGYAVLDDSALNSLKRLDSLVEARAWLAGHRLDMQLPVIYRLIEN